MKKKKQLKINLKKIKIIIKKLLKKKIEKKNKSLVGANALDEFGWEVERDEEEDDEDED